MAWRNRYRRANPSAYRARPVLHQQLVVYARPQDSVHDPLHAAPTQQGQSILTMMFTRTDQTAPAPATPVDRRPPRETDPPRRLAVVEKGLNTMKESLDIVQILSILRRRKNLILGTIVLLTLLGAGFAFYVTPKYTAQSDILLDVRKTTVI